MKQLIWSTLIFIFPATILAQNVKLVKMIPAGYNILDEEKCDINLDGYSDYIVVLEKQGDDNPESLRPLLIIEGRKDGSLKVVERNDNIVLCKDCGGIYGDPYQRIFVKNNYFSAEHYGGSNWRWTRIITFKYDKKTNQYLLHKDAGETYHIESPDNKDVHPYKKEHWQKVAFKNYKIEW